MNQVKMEKLKWKNAHTSEAFKINILLRRWQDCLDCRLKSPDFIHAMLSLSQLRSGDELECFQPLHVSGFFFPLLVVVVGGVSLSLSLLSSLPPSLPAFLSLVFWPAVPVVWWSPSVLLTFRCFCQFWSSRHPSQWNVIRRKVNTPLVHLQQHLMPLEGISQSAFNSASAASSGMVLSSHKQDLWKENDTVNMLLM